MGNWKRALSWTSAGGLPNIRERTLLSSQAEDDTTYLLMSDLYTNVNIHGVFAHHSLIRDSNITCRWSTIQTLFTILLTPDTISELQLTFYFTIHNSEIIVKWIQQDATIAFVLRNGFTLHVSGDNSTHHQEYICCIWPQVGRYTYVVILSVLW